MSNSVSQQNQPQPAQFGLVVISAPSGTGKSTLCARLLKNHASRLELSISTTSRSPRGTEKDGIEYYFLSEENFKTEIFKDQFAEWALVHGNYYGTSKKTLNEAWNRKMHVLLDIDVQGADSLKEMFGHRCARIFIAPPNFEVLEQRLRNRGTDNEDVIQKRLLNAKKEMLHMNDFDHVITNDELEVAYQHLEKIVLEILDRWEGNHG